MSIYYPGGGSDQEIDVANRVRTLVHVNPYMARNPRAVLALATNPRLSPTDLVEHGGALYGMQAADTIKEQLGRMGEATQRSVFNTLSVEQQATLRQGGYNPPSSDKDWLTQTLDTSFGGAGKVANRVLGVAGDVVGPAVTPLLNTLTWAGDQPARAYRTIRTMDAADQKWALGGAVAGGFAAMALGATGPASGTLGTITKIGFGALAGGTTAAFIANPDDWRRAWSDTANGERSFKLSAQRKADELLGNPQLVSLAYNFADSDYDMHDMARDLAGIRDGDIGRQIDEFAKIAARFATPGTPEYQTVYNNISEVALDPKFQEAVQTLQRGKISFGRDVASGLGLDPGSPQYNIVSGSLDAAWVVGLDPTLVLGKVGQWNRARRTGISMLDGADGVKRFVQLSKGTELNPLMRAVKGETNAVRNLHIEVAKALEKETPDFERIRQIAPDLQAFEIEMYEYRNARWATGDIPVGRFNHDDFIDMFVHHLQMAPLMRGIGTMRGSDKIIVKGLGPASATYKKITSSLRSFTYGLTDPRLEREALDTARDLFATGDDELIGLADQLMPGDIHGVIDQYGAIDKPWLYNEANPRARELGRKIGAWQPPSLGKGKIPVVGEIHLPGPGSLGDLVTKMTTMVPAGKAIALAGPDAPRDIKAFTELMGVMGMPQYMRRAYSDVIMAAPNPAQRMRLMAGMLDNALTMSGIRALDGGDAMVKRVLQRFAHVYGPGEETHLLVNGTPQANAVWLNDMAKEMIMPNLTELRQAVKSGLLAKSLGIADIKHVDYAINKVWKPAVLLRPGFILRAGGEEMLNFMLRGGYGSMIQNFGARSVAHLETWKQAQLLKRTNPAALTDDMKRILEIGPMPRGLRKLDAIMARSNYTTPMRGVLERYSTFLRTSIEDGLGFDIGLPTFAENVLPHSVADAALNIKGNLNALALGNRYSWRRLLAGGIDSSFLRSADAFENRFATTLMREVSASDAGVHDRGYDKTDVRQYLRIDNVTGEERMEKYIVDRSRQRRLVVDDPYFANAHHSRSHAVVEDEDGAAWARENAWRVWPTQASIPQARIPEFAEQYQAIDDLSVRMIVNEYLNGDPRREGLIAIMEDFRKHGDARIGDAVRANLLPDETDFATVQKIIEDLAKQSKDAGLRGFADRLASGGQFLAKLDRIGDKETRRALAVVLRSTDGLGISAADLRAGVRQLDSEAEAALRSRIDGLEEARALWDPTDPEEVLEFSRLDAEIRAAQAELLAGTTRTNPFVASLVDLEEQSVRQLRGRALHASRQDEAQLTQRLIETTPGTRATRPLAAGQVMLYVPPTIPQGTTFEGLLLAADNREVIARNEDIVRALIVADATGADSLNLLADIELAEELTVAAARASGTEVTKMRMRTVQMDRKVRDGRIGKDNGPLIPIFKRTKGKDQITEAWSVPRKTVANRLEYLDEGLDDAATEMAKVQFGYIRQYWTKGTQEGITVRWNVTDEIDEAGNPVKTPLVHELRDGKVVPIPEGERIVNPHGRKFQDAHGNELDWHDENFFKELDVRVGAEGEMMWTLVGPMVEDSWDDVQGVNRLIPKEEFKVQAGEIVPSEDVVRAYRSRVDHVQDTPDVANMVAAEVTRPVDEGWYQNVVRRGFDDFIGPWLDALARKPMAFHFFHQRYEQNLRMSEWLIDPELKSATSAMAGQLLKGKDRGEIKQVAAHARELWNFEDKAAKALKRTDVEALAWLRGHTQTELTEMLARAQNRVRITGADAKVGNAAKYLQARDPAELRRTISPEMKHQDFIAMIEAVLPPRTLDSVDHVASNWTTIQKDPLLSQINMEDWEVIVASKTNLEHIHTQAGDFAAEAAIGDMMPFIDSHELKTQWAEGVKGMLPFWYAEENFLKRWARTILLDPASIRRAQLGYMGLKTAGFIRTDESGRDWFVYPGSTVLAEAMSAIGKPFGMGGVLGGVGSMLQSPTDIMLPGLNSRAGTPQFSPLITVPLDVMQSQVPEVTPLSRALTGDFNSQKMVLAQFVPAGIYNLYSSVFSTTDSNVRYASAQTAAIAQLLANDALPADADAGQRQDFLDKVADHARIIVVSQALSGFFTPGAPSQITTGSDGGFFGGDVEDPRRLLSSIYSEFITNQGIEQGTISFLKAVPLANLTDITAEDALAMTVGQTTSTSGAPLPATEGALKFYDDNADYFGQFPDAGPWLLPQGEGDAHSQFAYDQFTVNGLKKRRSPEEFMTAIQFKKGAHQYFQAQDMKDKAVAKAQLAGNDDLAGKIEDTWSIWATNYKASHPVFESELLNSDGRERRAAVLSQMRVIVNDPEVPKAPHFDTMATVVKSFDLYSATLTSMANDRSAVGTERKELIKKAWGEYLDGMTTRHPEIAPFILTIIKPESRL